MFKKIVNVFQWQLIVKFHQLAISQSVRFVTVDMNWIRLFLPVLRKLKDALNMARQRAALNVIQDTL